jgi:5'/3'-nucleotidase
MRIVRVVALAIGVLALASGCTLTGIADRYSRAAGTLSEPFWCAPDAGTALSPPDCVTLSVELDQAAFIAHAYFHASDATAHGASLGSYTTGVGAPARFHDATATFDAGDPDTLLYDGTGANAQVAGIEWNVVSSTAPDGLTGPNDDWTDNGDGTWTLRVWVLRPFQNQVDAFAPTHPCLAAGGPVYDLEADCYTDTHPNPTEILVTNDDGYDADGIDVAVEDLLDVPTVHVTVSAPATNQSGSGDKTSPGPLNATLETTQSGYDAWAVQGTPGDSVLYALDTLHLNPDLVVSGINNGQNLGPIVDFSGTVGAARIAARANIPAIAVSQGLMNGTVDPQYPVAATTMLAKVGDFLFGRAGPARFQDVVNINAPTCAEGSVRGVLDVPSGTSFDGRPFLTSDCMSTVPPTSFADDVDAFINGYTAVSTVGKK